MGKLLIPMEIVEVLKPFKDTKEWAAMQVLFDIYTDTAKDRVFNSKVGDKSVIIRHAEETGGYRSLKYIKDIINNQLKRESEDG